jgi:hypothetical protein
MPAFVIVSQPVGLQPVLSQQAVINVAIKHCHINKIYYSRFARPLRGNRKTWQLLLRQVHIFQIEKEIFSDSCKKRLSLKYQQESALCGIIGASRIGEIQPNPLHRRGGPHHVQASQRPTVSL